MTRVSPFLSRTTAVGVLIGIVVAGAVVVGVRLAGADPGGPPTRNTFTFAGVLHNADGGAVTTATSLTFVFHRMGMPDCTPSAVMVTPNTSGAFSVLVPVDSCASSFFNGADVSYEVMQATERLTPDGGVPITPVPYARFADQAGQGFGIPPGTIVPYAGDRVPDGWLLCDGRAVERTAYARLFSAIAIRWGTGDGVTTFNIPDLRGRFLRGLDTDSGRDPDRGRTVGSIQTDQVGPHSHAVVDPGHSHPLTIHAGGSGSIWVPAAAMAGSTQVTGASVGTSVSNVSVQSSSGRESRPVNAAVNFIIRY